jgi:hypothetical protein
MSLHGGQVPLRCEVWDARRPALECLGRPDQPPASALIRRTAEARAKLTA